MSTLELVISPREKDLGGFTVRRILPYASHRMVGPFIFFDHMGPAEFEPGNGMTVRPHPHIGLATVTYLFEGKVHHRDSLGSSQHIEPGDINWMTAGRGIVHSERTPKELLNLSHRMHGIQLWVALPEEVEDIEPSFVHHPSKTLPEFSVGKTQVKLLLGEIFNKISPVKVLSDLFYFEAKIPKGEVFEFSSSGREAAVYPVTGKIKIEDSEIECCTMAVAKTGSNIEVKALEDSKVMFLGGSPVGERFIYWNFVSSSREKIDEAKKDWKPGPRDESRRFKKIPDDKNEFIPLPEEVPPPKGTIM
jgi:hypothetical protein